MATSTNTLNMRIVILGSTGQIGNVISNTILKDFPSASILKCTRNARPEYFQFDPFNDDWNKLGKVDALINSIGIIEETGQMTFKNVHVGLTLIMLENRKLIGNPRIIQISVLGADKQSKSRFLSTKAEGDAIIIENEDCLVIRPSIVCTHNTVMVQKFKLLKKVGKFFFGYLPFPAKTLHTQIQPLLGEDLATVISQLITSKKAGIIEIGGPDKISLKEIIENYLKLKPIAVSQSIADLLIPLITKIFPSLINQEQFYLLKRDNVTEDPSTREFFSTLHQTQDFWRKELSE